MLEGDYISNHAIASWLLGRVNSRLANVKDDAEQAIIYDEMFHSLSESVIELTKCAGLPWASSGDCGGSFQSQL